MSDDQELRAAFQRLRREEAESAPELEHLLTRARVDDRDEGVGARWRWLIALAATAGIAALVLTSIQRGEHEAPDLAATPTPTTDRDVASSFELGRWTMPTDVLLDLPGSDLLERIPEIGATPLAPFETTPPDSSWRTL